MTGNTNYKIDTHVHILPEYRLRSLLQWMKNAFPGHEVSETCQPLDIVRDLHNSGITHFFNLVYPIKEEETEALNEFNLSFCRTIPGAIPFASVHPETENKPAAAEKALRTNECAGFKLHPFVQKFDPWDSRMDPFYAFLQDVRKPVIFHTGFEDFYRRRMPLSKLKELLKKFPKLPAVFVHMAFPELEELFGLMEEFPDLYIDITGVLVFFREDFRSFLPEKLADGRLYGILADGLEKYHHRMFFGSDHPVGWGTVGEIYKDLSFLPGTNDILRDVNYGSAVKFIDRFLPDFDWDNNLQNSTFDEIKNNNRRLS